MVNDAEGEVLLIGRYFSPFVRRVAVTLRYFQVPYRHCVVSNLTEMPELEKHNPIGRIPVMVLASGEILIDSAAMLDYLDERASPGRALMPASGLERRRAFFILMTAAGTIERAMTANEEQRRPVDKQISNRLDRLRNFTRRGLTVLDVELGGRTWFLGDRMLQPDITAAVGLTFIRRVHPGLVEDKDVPALSQLTERCEAMPEFQATWIDLET